MATDNHSVTTTYGEVFTAREHQLMACMIYKRFGRDSEVAAAAWRRLLGNSCTESAFMELVQAGDRDYQGILAEIINGEQHRKGDAEKNQSP